MAREKFAGLVCADIVDIRFPFSGRISGVFRRRGELVKKGEILASLDRTLLQKELDRQLADYERIRAGFEIFGKEHSDPGDDITKYNRTIVQAQLNVSVKDVEIAKIHLDQADLVCSVTGQINDDGGNRIGLYVTPASNSYSVIDLENIYVKVELPFAKSAFLSKDSEVKFIQAKKSYPGIVRAVIPAQKFLNVEIKLSDPSGLLPGITGIVTV